VAQGFKKARAYLAAFKKIALTWDVQRTVILKGPRRVGKTVLLHQLVAGAIGDGFPPQQILFVPIDTPLYSGMPLERLLALFARQTGRDPAARRIVIFDEIQCLKNWEVHLKALTDKHPNTRFIASGSAAAALKLKSHESGAGRFTDFYLPPLTFAEFLNFADLERHLIRPEPGSTSMRFTMPDVKHLNAAFIDYLNFGGFPESVLNPQIRRNTQRYLGRDIIDNVVLRDLPSLYGIQDVQEPNRLFNTIAYHSGREISLDGLTSGSGVAKNTIARYLACLEAAFLIVRVRRVDDAARTFQRMRQFKAYLTNPSMRAALLVPLNEDHEAMGAMAETAIFSQWFHSAQLKNIHYARWKSGRHFREVDLVRVDPARLRPSWAYEIKWSDRYVDQPQELVGLVECARRNANRLCQSVHRPGRGSRRLRSTA
jgi:hypothetical protein